MICMSRFHPSSDFTFPLPAPFFFSHRSDTLVQQVNLSLVPQSELYAAYLTPNPPTSPHHAMHQPGTDAMHHPCTAQLARHHIPNPTPPNTDPSALHDTAARAISNRIQQKF